MIKADIIGVSECLYEVGISINAENTEMLLSEIIENSIQFISFIIELETRYNFELPDEYLLVDQLDTVKNLCVIINNILEKEEFQ